MTASFIAGIVAGLASSLLGSAWQVSTREATAVTGFAPIDLALLRYGVPALALGCFLVPLARRARLLDKRWLALMTLGGGLPFGLLAIGGTRHAPAAHMAVFVAGAIPLFTAIAGWMITRELPGWRRAGGLILIAAGLVVLGLPALDGGLALRGDLMFLAAAALWSVFGVAARQSGLSPWEATAWVNASSLVLLLPWWLAWGGGTLAAAAPSQLAWVIAWQGLLAGLVGFVLYVACVRLVGAVAAAAFGGLVPVLTTLVAGLWLGEPVGPRELMASALASCGVVLAVWRRDA